MKLSIKRVCGLQENSLMLNFPKQVWKHLLHKYIVKTWFQASIKHVIMFISLHFRRIWILLFCHLSTHTVSSEKRTYAFSEVRKWILLTILTLIKLLNGNWTYWPDCVHFKTVESWSYTIWISYTISYHSRKKQWQV